MNRVEDKNPSGGVSIHAVDIARGVPASGLKLCLWRLDGRKKTEIASGVCTVSGLFEHPVSTGAGIDRGMFEVEFDVGSYYRSHGIEVPAPSFVEVAVFRFGIDKVSEHFHLPFKFTPWGFSLFRGGA